MMRVRMTIIIPVVIIVINVGPGDDSVMIRVIVFMIISHHH